MNSKIWNPQLIKKTSEFIQTGVMQNPRSKKTNKYYIMELIMVTNKKYEPNLLSLKEALKYPISLDFSLKSQFADFSCLPGCEKCCGYSYYLPSEIKDLPEFIIERLIEKENKFEIIKRNKRCIFYSHSTDHHFYCSIYDKRPIRCRIYPFFPLIVNKRVIITLEPSLKMLCDIDKIKTCPGIGKKGKAIESVKKECLEYLNHLIHVPKLLDSVVLDNYRFNQIRNDKWFYTSSLEKRRD